MFVLECIVAGVIGLAVVGAFIGGIFLMGV